MNTMPDVAEAVNELINRKPEYRDILQRILTYEDNNKQPDSPLLNRENKKHGTDYDTYWEWSDVAVQAARLNYLVTQGIATVLFSSQSTTRYCLTDRQAVRDVLEAEQEWQNIQDITPEKEAEVPDDIFKTVVGYNDILWAMRKSLESKRHHILLKGPPATGKTVMLYEINRCQAADPVLGHSASKAGLTEELFDKQPRYLTIDELSRLKREGEGVLLSLMETGNVKVTKHDKHKEMNLTCNIYAAANRLKGLSEELLSRFEIFELEPYTREEFTEVCRRVLTMREGCSADLAEHIASGIFLYEIQRDFRVAVRTARLCDSPDEVKRYLKLVKRYQVGT